MSGRDSSSSGGGVGVTNDTPCSRLRFEAQLTSPQPAVVSLLTVNDVLEIVVVNMAGQLVAQALKNGQIAGGLAGPDAMRLRNCIDQGHSYTATVRTINGGQVRVLVEHI